MFASLARRLALLAVVVAGCNSSDRRRPPDPNPPITGRGTKVTPQPLAIDRPPLSPARQAEAIDDPAQLIPPPPKLAELTKRPPAKDAPPEPRPQEPQPEPEVKRAEATDVVVPPDVVKPVEAREPVREPARVADEGLAALKRLHERAAANYGRMEAYEARLTRRESINGKANPQEVIRFQFRRQPYSVHLKWIGGEGVGREVIYVQRRPDSKMFVLPTKADSFPLPPMRMSFAPDDSMVRSKTRHDIREAGLGAAIKHLGNLLALVEKNPGQRSRLKFLGPVQRPEFAGKLEGVEETIPPRAETLLPKGGKRLTFYDPGEGASGGLPVLVITQDDHGREVEYYCFDRFLYPVRLDDSDFDPERAWKK
jgi:hypothetical protein